MMMMMGSCLLLVVSSLTTVQKFPLNRSILRRISPNYEQQQQMLRSATESRVHRSMSSSDDASTTQQSPWVSDKAPKSAKEKASFKNQVPFREEVYETVKGAIELLTKRLNMNKDLAMSKLSLDEQAALSMKTLTVDEAQWLAAAVEVILDDAYKYGPPARPIKINAAQEDSTSQ